MTGHLRLDSVIAERLRHSEMERQSERGDGEGGGDGGFNGFFVR